MYKSLNYFLLKMNYYKNLRLKDMIIWDNITLDSVYDSLKKNKIELTIYNFTTILETEHLLVQGKKIIFEERMINIQIVDKNKKVILKEIHELLGKPIFIKFFKKNQNIENINIISRDHLFYVLEKLDIKKPIFNCIPRNIKENLEYLHILRHFYCDYIHYINEEIENDNISLDSFNKIIQREFKFDYEIPDQFEPNYKYYFSYYEYQDNKKFTIYIDKCRSELFEKFRSSEKGKLTFYYGSRGKGKSITLIILLKYWLSNDSTGTLYINCKTFYKLFEEKKINLIKEILKNEIIYLFKNEFESYKCLLKYINNFKLTNIRDFWDLIYNIIKSLKNQNKKYFIAFDQYKDTFIKLNEIIKIFNSINREQFKIIGCCSLNDKDIRKMKIFDLFESLGNKNLLKRDDIIYSSIEDVLEIEKFTIDNGDIFDNNLEKIGKTIKNYNLLSFIYKYKKDDLEKFIENEKIKIKDNILEFFNIDIKSDSSIGTKDIFSIFTFSVDVEYDEKYFKNNIDYLPLKYFNVKIKKEEGKNIVGYIEYLFPLVEEALVDIYNLIINMKGTIYKILKDSKIISGGAQGHLFEKYVIYNMNPKNTENKFKILFNDFLVTKNELIEKFLPKENEKFRNKKGKVEKKILKDGIYLFEQKIFGGKSFDTAIIELNTIKGIQVAKVFLFQISIHKDNIYSISTLLKYIKTMIEYFDIYYTFSIKEENVYFTYIFDISCPLDTIDKCKKANIPYIFFSSKENIFISSEGKNISSSDNIFICPYSSKLFKFDKNNEIQVENIYDVYKKNHQIDESLEEYIFKMIRDSDYYNFGKTFIKIKYIRSSHITGLSNYYKYLCINKVKDEKEKKVILSLWSGYSHNDVPKYIYIVIFHKNTNEIRWNAIFYYNSRRILDSELKLIIGCQGDLYDIYEVTANNEKCDIFDYIADESSLFK